MDSIKSIAMSMREDKEKLLMIFVCSVYCVDVEDVYGKNNRKKEVVSARKMFCYIMNNYFEYKQEYIATVFNTTQTIICNYIGDVRRGIKENSSVSVSHKEIMELAKDL